MDQWDDQHTKTDDFFSKNFDRDIDEFIEKRHQNSPGRVSPTRFTSHKSLSDLESPKHLSPVNKQPQLAVIK